MIELKIIVLWIGKPIKCFLRRGQVRWKNYGGPGSPNMTGDDHFATHGRINHGTWCRGVLFCTQKSLLKILKVTTNASISH